MEVKKIRKENSHFVLETSQGLKKSKYLIWAGGEAQNPSKDIFPGSEHCIHNIEVDSWGEFSEDRETAYIIGGYESGIDSAVNLAQNQVEATVFDKNRPWALENADPSISISPYTMDRLNQCSTDMIDLRPDTEVEKVEKTDRGYEIITGEEEFLTDKRPVLASGFKGSTQQYLEEFFEFNDGPKLTEKDESTITDNLFLVGPEVKHGEAIFCFIYKYRQRFAVIAEEIAERKDLDAEKMVEEYKDAGMYLGDLEECCEDICKC